MIGRRCAAALACCLVAGACVFFGESPTGPGAGGAKELNGLDPYAVPELVDMVELLSKLAELERRHFEEHGFHTLWPEQREIGSGDAKRYQIGFRLRGKMEWLQLPQGVTLTASEAGTSTSYTAEDVAGAAACHVYVGKPFEAYADASEREPAWRKAFEELNGWRYPERQGEIVCGPPGRWPSLPAELEPPPEPHGTASKPPLSN